MSTNSKRLQILVVEDRKSQKGNTYWVAQCVIYDAEGKPKVGEFWHFNKDIVLTAGDFNAVFEVDVGMDRKVTASLTSLVPYVKPAVSAPAAPSK